MGRDLCPVCDMPIGLPSAHMPPTVCLLEHGVHIFAAFMCLIISLPLSMFMFERRLREDAWRQLHLARATGRSRTSLDNDTTDLMDVRMHTFFFLVSVIMLGRMYTTGWIHVLWNSHYSIIHFIIHWYKDIVASLPDDIVHVQCPTDPTCFRNVGMQEGVSLILANPNSRLIPYYAALLLNYTGIV